MRIKVDTAVLAQRADAAEKKIRDLRSRFDGINTVVQNSVNYWEGRAGDAHRREFQEYHDDITQALARFEENVIDLRTIAGIYIQGNTDISEMEQDLPGDVIV